MLANKSIPGNFQQGACRNILQCFVARILFRPAKLDILRPFHFVAARLHSPLFTMIENHEKLNAFFDQVRSRLSLVEVFVYKDNRLSNVILGTVASVGRNGLELNLRGFAGVTIYFDFCGADIQYCHDEPFGQGWKVNSPDGATLVFFELRQQQIAS